MNINTKKAVIDCLQMQDADKLSTRLACLISDAIIDILANNKIAIELIKIPTFDNIRELRSFANDFDTDLSLGGIEACECDGILNKYSVALEVEAQQICIRYEYSWKKDDINKKDYDYLYLTIDQLKDNKEIEFKTI